MITGLSHPRASVVAVLAALALAVSVPRAAFAQAERNVTIDFEVGDFDSVQGDWSITAVNVSGDLTTGREFTVELRDGDGELLWSGTDEYTPPQTTIEVDTFVAVGDVEEAGIAQRQSGDPANPTDPVDPVDPVDPIDPVDPVDPVDPLDPVDPVDPTDPAPPGEPAVADDEVVNTVDRDDDGDVDEDDQVIADQETPIEPPAEVEGDVVTQPPEAVGPVSQGNGPGGAGQLALSMVVAVIFVAILFRSPLPSATTVRWRK